MKKLSIIIPTYNESKTIAQVLERVFAVNLPGFTREVLVIDDGSTDNTIEKLSPWNKKITVITLPKNKGKGGAVTEGLKLRLGILLLSRTQI